MSGSEKNPHTPKFRVEFNWKLALFALLLLPVLIGLGIWQLQRAEEKRTIQESWQNQQALPPVNFWDVEESAGAQPRRVFVRGVFDDHHYWLLENQILDGRLGYNVVMPLQVTGSSVRPEAVVLINRGWVPAGAYRRELPDVDTPKGELQVTGSLVVPSSNRLIDEAGETPDQWPVRTLEINTDAMTRQLRSAGYNVDLHAQVLRIDEDSPSALAVNWQPVNMSPATHQGYAVQWFALAVALVVLSLFAQTNLGAVLFRRRHNSQSE